MHFVITLFDPIQVQQTVLFSNYFETDKFLQNLHIQITIYIILLQLIVYFSNKNIFDHCRMHTINIWLLLVLFIVPLLYETAWRWQHICCNNM